MSDDLPDRIATLEARLAAIESQFSSWTPIVQSGQLWGWQKPGKDGWPVYLQLAMRPVMTGGLPG